MEKDIVNKNENSEEISKLQQENKRLKEQMQNTYETSQELLGEMQMEIDKIIEYLDNDLIRKLKGENKKWKKI